MVDMTKRCALGSSDPVLISGEKLSSISPVDITVRMNDSVVGLIECFAWITLCNTLNRNYPITPQRLSCSVTPDPVLTDKAL